ncbi:MAG: peptidase M28, partial [Erythrobacter sp.]
MKRFALAACSALLLTACQDLGSVGTGADALDLPDVADGTISEETMKRVTERLSSDEFEGRAPGTVGEEKTVAYLIEEFEKAGLQP